MTGRCLHLPRAALADATFKPGDKVSLYVSDLGADDVTATVGRVYMNAIDIEVADLTLPNGQPFTQCTKFLEAAAS